MKEPYRTARNSGTLLVHRSRIAFMENERQVRSGRDGFPAEPVSTPLPALSRGTFPRMMALFLLALVSVLGGYFLLRSVPHDGHADDNTEEDNRPPQVLF